MNEIDIQNPTASIPTNSGKDINGVRMGRIYGDASEMLRLHNAYQPSLGDKYSIDKLKRKRGEYELRQLQGAIMKQRSLYAAREGISILDVENRISENPEIMETIFQDAVASLPKTCRTLIGDIKIAKTAESTQEKENLDNE